MRKILILLTFSLCLFLAFVAGCDDDDCATCPAPIDYLAWTDGIMNLQSDLYCNMYIWAYIAQNPFIDSIKIGDTLCYFSQSYWEMESDPYYYLYYDEDDDQYEAGDTAVISIYGSNRSSTCRLPLLHYYDDEIEITVPSTYDTTVAYGEDMIVTWNKVDNAEWYSIGHESRVDSNGTTVWIYNYTYTYDTAFVVPDTLRGHPVQYSYIYPMACTGPDPSSSSGNWQGDLVCGKIYSYADNDACRVYFENPGTKIKKDYVKPVEMSKKNPGDLVKKAYEAYK